MSLHACVRVYVRVCARACVCACVIRLLVLGRGLCECMLLSAFIEYLSFSAECHDFVVAVVDI